MSTLYSVDERIQNIFITPEGDEVDKETGEILDVGTLETLQMERSEKIDNILCFIKNLESDAAKYKAEMEYQKKRYERNKKKAQYLKEYLAEHMEPGKKFESAHGEIRWAKATSVDVPDVMALPEEYRREEITWTANRNDLKKLLKGGAVIPGASLVTKQHLQVK